MADYLIVGGGMAAAAAANGIREVDAKGTITILGDEDEPPYARPPLSKGYWKGEPDDKRGLKLPAGTVVLVNTRVVSIDRARHQISRREGPSLHYDKLLLATGGSPRKLPFSEQRIIYYRTWDDYLALRAAKGERVAVIGGGFIGSEIAAALALNNKKVTMVFPESGVCARAFPKDLSDFVTDYYRKKNVEVLAGENVAAVDKTAVITKSGRRIEADAVVAGIGITPNVELAKEAALEVSDGIEVNESLQTSDPDIYAAGDVARFFNPALGRRVRVEHEDNANTMGAAAGRSMAGAKVKYDHLPFFYSDLFDLGYEAVGDLDSRLQTEADWKEPFREGVLYYLAEGKVRGVLLWNTWGQVDKARALIGTSGRLPK
jgi:NADPH-dependent 2,4-dienoyl-CoA reductase/sulfur reductase-like enzyme